MQTTTRKGEETGWDARDGMLDRGSQADQRNALGASGRGEEDVGAFAKKLLKACRQGI